MKKKITIILACVLIVAVLFTGCGGVAEIKRPEASEGAELFTVEGSCTAKIDGNALTVSGTTNLMDGTNGVIAVLGANGEDLETFDFTVAGEEITHDFTVGEGWPEHIYAFITFDTQQAKGQPKEVTSVYGKKFENLDGEDVIWDLKGCIASFMSDVVEVK